jgi:uncharacterized protein
MPDMYHPSNRELQDRFDTRRLADRLADVKVRDHFTADDSAFIERLDMFFLATADADGRPTCSYKGGDPGFVRILDARTLAFPNYDGNGMYLSMGNVLANPAIGLLFLDFERQRRLRVEGSAQVCFDDPLCDAFPGAQFVVRVTPERVFPNCPRYIHRYQLVERSVYVPHPEHAAPVPAWKRADWAVDVLPAGDPARIDAEPPR